MTTNFILYQPLALGTGVLEDQNLYDLVMPTYRRQSVAMGGDFAASFQFSADDVTLERWRDNYLGAHFVEYFGTEVAFMGNLNTMRLTYNGQVQIVTLDEVYNNVAVRYQQDSSSAPAITAFLTDTASIARYGTKTLVVAVNGYMGATRAEQYALALISRLAMPRVFTQEVNWGTNHPTLQIDVKGYVHTLNWQFFLSTSKTAQNADQAITDALAVAEFVTTGSIEANTAQEIPESDYEPVWDRIRRITEHGTLTSKTLLAGCYQGRALDYWLPDINTITYRYDSKAFRQERRRVIYDANNAEIPEALVLPGRLIFTQDLMPGVPLASNLLDDPRIIQIGAIDFSKDGLALKAQPRDAFIPPPPPDEAVKMSLMAVLQKAKDPTLSRLRPVKSPAADI